MKELVQYTWPLSAVDVDMHTHTHTPTHTQSVHQTHKNTEAVLQWTETVPHMPWRIEVRTTWTSALSADLLHSNGLNGQFLGGPHAMLDLPIALVPILQFYPQLPNPRLGQNVRDPFDDEWRGFLLI